MIPPPWRGMIRAMPSHQEFLSLADAALLAQCDVHVYKSSGPGGQHRNKVCSAVRLKHRPTGLGAHGDDTRSQHENKRLALGRLRMKIACQCRQGVNPQDMQVPDVVVQCVHGSLDSLQGRRLQIGRKDQRFWQVVAFLLDLLEARQGRLAEAAACLGIGTTNMVRIFQSQPHALAAAQVVRKRHGLKPIL